ERCRRPDAPTCSGASLMPLPPRWDQARRPTKHPGACPHPPIPMKPMLRSAITSMLFILAASQLNAAVVISPDSFSGTPSGHFAYPAGNLIDGQGLSTTFVSGVTDFDAFIGAAPEVNDRGWMSNMVTVPYAVDFDLGARYS